VWVWLGLRIGVLMMGSLPTLPAYGSMFLACRKFAMFQQEALDCLCDLFACRWVLSTVILTLAR